MLLVNAQVRQVALVQPARVESRASQENRVYRVNQALQAILASVVLLVRLASLVLAVQQDLLEVKDRSVVQAPSVTLVLRGLRADRATLDQLELVDLEEILAIQAARVR